MAESTESPSIMSDEDPNKLCDPCKFRGIHKQAGTHCQDCSEDLCDLCEEIHRSMKVSRNHELKPFDDEKKTSIKQRNLIYATMVCEVHRSEVVSLLCLDHNEPYCRQCKLSIHRKCKTNTLKEVSEEAKSKEEMARFAENVKELTRKLQALKQSREKTKESLQNCSEKLIIEIQNFKQDIVTWANNLERDMLDEVESTKVKIINDIDGEVQTAEEIKSDILKSVKPGKMSFCPSRKLVTALSEITSMGTLTTDTKDESNICFQDITSLSKNETINVGTSGVTGCVFMPGGGVGGL